MSNPQATLSIHAEVALGLAGFSGIVIALGRRSQGKLTPLESRRHFNLFTFSGLVLGVSLLAMSLLHVDSLDQRTVWRLGSAILFFTGIPWMILDCRRIHALSPKERAQIRGYIIYPFSAVAIAALFLQAANLLMGQSWPFFIALVAQTAFSFQQFVLLVWSGLRGVESDS